MASSFRREDNAKAYFDLDLSDTEPSSTDKKPRAPRRDSQSSTSVPTTNNSNNAQRNLTLLALPAEIRIKIYDLLLVSRFDRKENPFWAVGKTCQKKICLQEPRAPGYRTMGPQILQTCKQIYYEANSILYSRNVFNFNAPEQMFSFVTQIGPANIEFVRSLDFWVQADAEISPWLRLLNTLTQKATGLKFIELAWCAERNFGWQIGSGGQRGLGDNVLFVRALARIPQLENLNISGFYAKHWTSYLGRETGAQVHAKCGHNIEFAEDGPEYDTWIIRTLNEENPRELKGYQKGTEDLIP